MAVSDTPHLVMVGVGVPGSGKTTYLKEFASRYGYAYVNPDDIRREITGDETDHSQETRVWSLVHKRIVNGLSQSVVVDATYTKKRDRRELIRLSRQHGTKLLVAYWFDVPLEVCLVRNSKRNRQVPEEVIRKMHNRLQINPPTMEEGFDEVIKIIN